jgi:hypothetical protein
MDHLVLLLLALLLMLGVQTSREVGQLLHGEEAGATPHQKLEALMKLTPPPG